MTIGHKGSKLEYANMRSVLFYDLQHTKFPIRGVGSIADEPQKIISRSTVRLNAANPTSPPVVALNYLNSPSNQDVLFAGVRVCGAK